MGRKLVASAFVAFVIAHIVTGPDWADSALGQESANTAIVADVAGVSAIAAPGAVAPPTDGLSLNDRLDLYWSQSDWKAIIDMLEAERAATGFKDNRALVDKLYAAYINQGLALIQAGDPVGAEPNFHIAFTIDPTRPDAAAGLRRLPAAGARLEILSKADCAEDRGFIRCEGTVKNISGNPLTNIMAIFTQRTSGGVFVGQTKSFIQGGTLAPNATARFSTFLPPNPSIASWDVQFREAFGGEIPHYREAQ